MANSAEFTAENSLALARADKSTAVVSTLLRKAVLLAAFGLFTANKPNEVFGVGTPEMNQVTMGLQNDPIRVQQSELSKEYEPLIESIIQHDYKNMSWRDTVPVQSSHSGSDPTFTFTRDANGGIATVTVTGAGTGFAGSPPTLIMVDATGSQGHGAVLIPTMSSATIGTVAVASAGYGYASGATIVVNCGYSEGEKFARPIFRWSKIKTIGYIYDSDRDAVKFTQQAAPSEKNKGGMLDLVGNAFVKQVANQAQVITQQMWTGAPTETDNMWTSQYGIKAAIDDGATTAVYAGVDRTIAANHWWRSFVDTTAHTFTLEDLVNDANLTKGLSELGGGVDLFLVHPVLLAKFKKEGTAYQVNVNTDDRLRELAQYGFKSDVLKYGNTYIIADGKCDSKMAIGLNTEAILVQFKNGLKFSMSELYDQHGIPGGIDGSLFYVTTEWMFAIVAPNLCVKYTNLS